MQNFVNKACIYGFLNKIIYGQLTLIWLAVITNFNLIKFILLISSVIFLLCCQNWRDNQLDKPGIPPVFQTF